MAVQIKSLIDRLRTQTTPLSVDKCRELAQLLELWELEATQRLLTDVFIKERDEDTHPRE